LVAVTVHDGAIVADAVKVLVAEPPWAIAAASVPATVAPSRKRQLRKACISNPTMKLWSTIHQTIRSLRGNQPSLQSAGGATP
jgi:hypothetical protein